MLGVNLEDKFVRSLWRLSSQKCSLVTAFSLKSKVKFEKYTVIRGLRLEVNSEDKFVRSLWRLSSRKCSIVTAFLN